MLLDSLSRSSNPVPGPDQALHLAEQLAPAVAWSLVILLATYVVARASSGRLRSALDRAKFQVNAGLLLARVLWALVWIVGFVLVLYQFGIGLTPLAAFIGVLGLAASLSLQTVLQNLVAGIYLLAEQPFRIGDHIAVVGPAGANHQGRVEDIQMRTTHLRNRDNELILVPNSVVFSGIVTNRSAVGGFVQHLTVTFPRKMDLAAVSTTMLPLLERLPSVLPDPAPRIRVDDVGEETWTASLALWAGSYEAASDATWAISQAFPEACVSGESVGT